MSKVHDVAIVGAGPAGIACAVQSVREGLDVIVFEKDKVGGLIRNANLVENYPGFPGGIKGTDLSALLEKQFHGCGAELIHNEVASVEFGQHWTIITKGGDTFLADSLVMATGTRPETPSWYESGSNILFEVADLLEFGIKGDVGILGGGDVAFDYALTVAQNGGNVSILTRSKPKAVKVLQERIKEHPSIQILRIGGIDELSDGHEGGVDIFVNDDGSDITHRYDHLLIAIGREAEDRLFKEASSLSQKGLYLIGDAAHIQFRQVSLAAGDGVKTAMVIAGKKEVPR